MTKMLLGSRLWPLIIVLALLPKTLFAELLVYPTRGLITDRQRVMTFALRHTGAKPETYKIGLQFYRMHPDGSDERVMEPTAEDRSAMKALRFSPRKVTLAPNVEQTVRVMLGDVKGLTDGDYRAHIHFEPSGDSPEAPRNVASAEGETSVAMELKTRVSVAVPVIYRRGNSSAKVTLTPPKIVANKEGSDLEFSMLTEGNAFPFGDFFAFFVPKAGGAPTQVAVVKGIPSYVPKRSVILPLQPPSGVKLSGGSLRLEYREHDAKPEMKPIAQVESALP